VAADGKPRITWHGKDFAATTEIVRLGDVEIAVRVPDLPDPWSRRFIAGVVAFERVERAANHLAPAHVLEMAACRWLEKGGTVETWREYEIVLGVTKSKTRPPGSLIQPFMKWARGGRNDTDGSLHRLSSAFDAWLAQKDRPDPYPRNGEPGTSALAKWLVDEHGYQAVAKAHDARLEYQAALKRGTVWVTHANGTERVYSSKAAAESQNEGPAYEEPAEWWDLEGFEPIGPGEYRRIDPETDEENEDDPLPERVKGEVRPEFHHRPDHQNYSESNSANNAAAGHDRGTANQAAAHGLARLRQTESRRKTPYVAPPECQPKVPTPGVGMHWCPKCSNVAIPIGARACRECEPNRTHSSGEQGNRSYVDVAAENVRLKARVAELEREVARLKAYRQDSEAVKHQSKQCWRTPSPLYAVLDRALHFDFDACPHDRPPEFNSLEMSWKSSNYVNSPFSARLNPEKHGPTDFVRKALEENHLGKTSFIVVPTMNYVNMLLKAGAEPIALGRVPWQDAQTGETHPSRPNITGFVLWGDQYTAVDRVVIMGQLKAEIAKLNY
jgi:hypothetical protein